MLKVLVNGSMGHMGREVCRLCDEDDRFVLAGGVDKNGGEYAELDAFTGEADVLVDFSHHSAVPSLAAFAAARKMPLVVATTGLTEEEKAALCEAAKTVPVFHSANMSLGIAVLARLARLAAAAFPDADIEIIEKHHNRKLDAPSGTALLLAEEIKAVRPGARFQLGRAGNAKRGKDEIGIHAIRAGNIVGEHEILICTANQTLSLKHEAHDRALFAEGALSAALFLVGKAPGLYDMKDLVAAGD